MGDHLRGSLVACALLAVAGAARGQPPGTDLYLAPLSGHGAALAAGAAVALDPEPGYDNQPFFLPDGQALMFTSDRAAEATEIFRFDLAASSATRLTDTAEAEYSPTALPDGADGFSVVRVEADGTQRLWRFDRNGENPRLLLPHVRGVGYHAWADADRVALFVLGAPPKLELASLAADAAQPPRRVARDVGRALHRVPAAPAAGAAAGADHAAGSARISFVAPRQDAQPARRWVHWLDPTTMKIDAVAPVLAESGDHDLAWTPDGTLLMAQGSVLHAWEPTSASWRPVRDFSGDGVAGITRLAVSPSGDRLALVARDAPGAGLAVRGAQGREKVQEAQNAGERGEWRAARRLLQRAARLLPAQPGLVRRLAGALSREGRSEEALALLRRLVAWKTPLDLTADPDLEPLRARPELAAEFSDLSSALAVAAAPIARATAEARFPKAFAGFIPEGVAHDPSSDRLFVSSARHGTIAVVAGGEAKPFADLTAAGFGRSVLGLATDPSRGLLWAAVAALPQGAAEPAGGRRSAEALGRTALCAIDLGNARLARCVPPPAGGERHTFNDLVVGADGAVYVSDPGAPALYLLRPGGKALELVLGAADLESPNGLALSTRQDALYIADYSLGLLRLDLTAPGARPRRMETPAATLVGIDGLVRWRTSLIAIQNGIAPARIVRLALDESGPSDASIVRVETLEIARSDWDEPTLGVVVRGELVYVANSHWPRFAEDGSLPGAAELDPPLLLRLRPGS